MKDGTETVHILRNSLRKRDMMLRITYSDNDTDQQVNDIQNMISDNVDILVVAAIDGDTLSTVLTGRKRSEHSGCFL